MTQLHFPRSILAEVDSVFDEAFRRADAMFGAGRGLDGRHGLTHQAGRYFPRFEVEETDAGWTLSADVPGLDPEGLEVAFEDGVLTVKGGFDGQAPAEGWQAVRTERARWRFERSFRFGRPVDADGVEARLVDGVLTLRVPRRGPQVVTVPVLEG
ncbi:MAG: Hsp20/alpha crystallin family protein [Alphaproteobacteria bacterium]|nr:Hsp20/alpha crystallin family protein [Alphaproteobacteria bacterium]